MKKIDFDNLPEVLPPELVDELVRLSSSVPVAQVWQDNYEKLSFEQLLQVSNEKSRRNREKMAQKRARMTEEEKKAEEEWWEKYRADPRPRFYGNMGEPETEEEYNRKYGGLPGGDEKDEPAQDNL